MSELGTNIIIKKFQNHLQEKLFPCLGARSALARNYIRYLVVDNMSSSHHDEDILSFLYAFIDEYRESKDNFYSAVVIFKGPDIRHEAEFDYYLWERLQALADMDAWQYPYDLRVSRDIHSPNFSFSLKEEAFYIIGLHGLNSRKARRFPFPALVFNAHAQFESLRASGKYIKMQEVIRARDLVYSGSINPMLSDFGTIPEVSQYSGKLYDKNWKCPLVIRHARSKSAPHSSS